MVVIRMIMCQFLETLTQLFLSPESDVVVIVGGGV
jgi:hypothetical protein